MLNQSIQNSYRHGKALWPTLLWAYVPALVVLGGITIFALASGRRGI